MTPICYELVKFKISLRRSDVKVFSIVCRSESLTLVWYRWKFNFSLLSFSYETIFFSIKLRLFWAGLCYKIYFLGLKSLPIDQLEIKISLSRFVDQTLLIFKVNFRIQPWKIVTSAIRASFETWTSARVHSAAIVSSLWNFVLSFA